MIKTKYNFRAWMSKTYPDVTLTPVYGIPAYVLDKPLQPIHMFEYNVQDLTNGQYIVFIGIEISAIKTLMNDIKTNGFPQRGGNLRSSAPTTFSSFEAWCSRNEVKILHRTFCTHKTPFDVFQTETISACPNVRERRTWYLYEIPYDDRVDMWFVHSPHILTQNNTVAVLIKASQSNYVSKRQRFVDRFELMQPIYEKLVGHCAKEEWDDAKAACEQYMGIQFEKEGTVDVEALKEAYADGSLGLFTRDITNLHVDDSETF